MMERTIRSWAKKLEIRRRAQYCAVVLWSTAAMMLGVQLVDCCAVPVPEWLAEVILTVSGAVVVWGLAGMLRRGKNGIGGKDVARRMDGLLSGAGDMFSCSAELLTKPEGALNSIEKLQLAHSRRVFEEQRTAILHRLAAERRLAVPSAACAVLVMAGIWLTMPLCRRGLSGLEYRLTGCNPGIVVLSPKEDAVQLVHSDVRIEVQVRRGHPEAVIHYVGVAGTETEESYPMHADPESVGKSSFVLYDVPADVKFKVTTDTLETPWRCLKMVLPPRLESVSVRVVHQPYTGLGTEETDVLRDLEAVEGDAVQIRAVVSDARGLRLRSEAKTLDFLREEGTFALDMTAEGTGSWELVADDATGNSSALTSFFMTVRPDLPPVIAQTLPEGDRDIHAGDGVDVAAEVSDDFGLSDVTCHYRVAGQLAKTVSFPVRNPAGAAGTETVSQHDDGRGPAGQVFSLRHALALDRKSLQPGDLIVCWLTAADNRMPVPNRSSSEPVYLSVVPDEQDVKQDGGGAGQEEQVDISDLIAESKRLLRQTWDVSRLDNPPADQLEEVKTGLADFKIEVMRRMTDLAKRLHEETPPEPFRTLFGNCGDALETAAGLVGGLRLAESIVSQEKALGALVRIQAELMKNKAKSDKAKQEKGGSGNSSEEKEKTQEQQENADSGESKVLEEALEKLAKLVIRQDDVNGQLQRGGQDAASAALGRQQELHAETGDLSQSLSNSDEAAQVRMDLQHARDEMSGGITALRRKDSRAGGIHGARALAQLKNAMARLEQVLRQKNAEQAKALAQEASRLAERQREEAASSRELQAQQSRGESTEEGRKDGRRKQEDLRRQTAKLKQRLDGLAAQLEEVLPETAAELKKHSAQLEKDDVDGHQKKAMNALLYKRFDKAGTEQQTVAESLKKLSDSIGQTADRMPQYTQEQLRQLLRKMQQVAAETRQAMNDADEQRASGKLREAGQRARQLAGELAQSTRDERADEIGRGLENGGANGGQDVLDSLNKAMELAAEYLRKFERNQAVRLNREFVAPPEKYRRLVEEYFKQLGKESTR